MREVLEKRREQFLSQCVKYLRFVLNDHFVLFLMVFLGFIALHYRQLLIDLPTNPWPIYLCLLAVTVLVQLTGQIGTYVKEADAVFLLTKEGELQTCLLEAKRRSLVLWASVQTLLQLILLPLYHVLGMSIWLWGILVVFLWLLKYYLLNQQLKGFKSESALDWEKLIAAEKRRQERILRFFSLFTTVKGISSSVNERSYLQAIAERVRKEHSYTWDYLYIRAYLRSGDFLPLTFRLVLLSCLVFWGIEESWLALGVGIVSHYLLLFQLLALYSVYDYQYMTALYPLGKEAKKEGFKRSILWVLRVVFLVQVFFSIVFLDNRFDAFYMALGILFLHSIYFPIKLKKLID